MDNINLKLILTFCICIFSCIGKQSKKEASLDKDTSKAEFLIKDNMKVASLVKDTSNILDLETFVSTKYDINKLFKRNISDSIGFTDTLFSNNIVKILKLNSKEVNKKESKTILKKIIILNHNQRIFEKDSLIDIGNIEYNPKINFITIPILYDVDTEDFSTYGNLLLYEASINKIIEINKDHVNLTNAPIIDDSTIYFISNYDLWCYRKNKLHKVVTFDNPLSRIFELNYTINKGFEVIYFKKYPDDSIPLRTYIPFDSIFKNHSLRSN